MPSGAQLALVVAQTFLVAAMATWLIRGAARRRGWLAPPRPDRWHREPTALYGGVGIFAGFALGLLWHVPWSPFMGALLVLTGIMFVTGLVDDATDIRPQTKIVLQLVGGLLLYAADFHFNSAFAWWLDMGIVVFWVVAITNAMNLLDNMNGLAAGTAVIAGVSRLLLFHQTGNVEGVLASAVFIGAVLGFLVFNFPRASIFMGDGGSFTIGFALAALNLTNGESYSKSVFSIFVFPVMALALPIFDTTLVSVARYFSGRAISQGGRDHASHRLVAIGLSETSAVLMLWTISAAAGVIAYLLYNVGFSYAMFAVAILVLGLALFGAVLSRVRVYPEGTEPDGPASAWGFTLPGELLYKRQMLWVILDGITVVLALSVAVALVRNGSTRLTAGVVGGGRQRGGGPVRDGAVPVGLGALRRQRRHAHCRRRRRRPGGDGRAAAPAAARRSVLGGDADPGLADGEHQRLRHPHRGARDRSVAAPPGRGPWVRC